MILRNIFKEQNKTVTFVQESDILGLSLLKRQEFKLRWPSVKEPLLPHGGITRCPSFATIVHTYRGMLQFQSCLQNWRWPIKLWERKTDETVLWTPVPVSVSASPRAPQYPVWFQVDPSYVPPKGGSNNFQKKSTGKNVVLLNLNQKVFQGVLLCSLKKQKTKKETAHFIQQQQGVEVQIWLKAFIFQLN